MRMFTNRRRPMLGALAMASAALALGACGDDDSSGGGGDSEEDRAKATVQAYLDGFKDKDAGKACDALADSIKKQADSAGGCEKVLGAQVKAVKQDDLDKLGDVEFKEVKITGDKARVTVEGGGDKATFPLLKQGDEWKITGQAEL